MKRHYTAIFQPEKVGYSVWLNDVRGVISQGDSLDEAIANIKDALALCIECNGELPESCFADDILLEEGQFSLPIEFDCNEFNT